MLLIFGHHHLLKFVIRTQIKRLLSLERLANQLIIFIWRLHKTLLQEVRNLQIPLRILQVVDLVTLP